MPSMTTSQFQQKLRDGEVLGISRATTYQALKAKGYVIEGEPAAPAPTPATHGGIIGYFGATMQNALKELGGLAKGTAHYATNPGDILPAARDTVAGLTRTAAGLGESFVEGVTGQQIPQYNPDGTTTTTTLTDNQQTAKTVMDSASNAVQHPAETFKEHPLSTLSMVAPVAGAGAKAAGLSKVAKVAELADPVQWATKGIPAAARLSSKVGEQALGKMTGAGAGAVEMASKADSPAFIEGMRADPLQQARQLASDAQQGLDLLKKKRSTEYLKTNEAMRSITTPMDNTPVQKLLHDTMAEFRIGDTEKGVLDKMRGLSDADSEQFLRNMMNQPAETSLSPLVKAGIGDGPAAKKISTAIEYAEKWDDYTPDGLDRLQKALSALDPKPGTQESAFITKIKRGVQQVVKDQYPEYDKLLSRYHEASNDIEELQSAIGKVDRQSIETTVRKIAQSMKTGNQGFEIRNAVLQELEQATGVRIRERAAGMALNQVMPRGLAGVGAGIGTAAVIGQLISPTFLIALAASSPRVVGEVLSLLGVGKKYLAPVTAKLREIVPPDYFFNAGVGAGAINDATDQ